MIFGDLITLVLELVIDTLTLVDDCTRFTWVFLFKRKSDAATVIPNLFNMIATQFNGKIKGFRSDNAKQLHLPKFFNEKGVLHQFSCVDRPRHNSVVERKHQHLLSVARALYFSVQGSHYILDRLCPHCHLSHQQNTFSFVETQDSL